MAHLIQKKNNNIAKKLLFIVYKLIVINKLRIIYHY